MEIDDCAKDGSKKRFTKSALHSNNESSKILQEFDKERGTSW